VRFGAQLLALCDQLRRAPREIRLELTLPGRERPFHLGQLGLPRGELRLDLELLLGDLALLRRELRLDLELSFGDLASLRRELCLDFELSLGEPVLPSVDVGLSAHDLRLA